MAAAAKEPAEVFVDAFTEVYIHLHARRAPTEYAPSRESLAVLRHLVVSGPLTPTVAAQHFGRSQAAMSEMLNRLIERGLLARVTDPDDRRRHLVWLTDEGQHTVTAASRPLDMDLVQRALERLPGDTASALLQSFTALARAVRDLATHDRSRTDDDAQ